MITEKQFANKLRRIRQDKGLTLRDVSKQSGLYVSRICCYEQGQNSAPLFAICKLARAYGFSAVSQFMHFVENY